MQEAGTIMEENFREFLDRLRENGEFNDTLIQMLKLNVRVPETFMGDLGAQIAACTVGSR
ncbi:MAG: hydantoinase B/oxoprolinase family protein, partial [Alphaproteobacteria bacterium]